MSPEDDRLLQEAKKRREAGEPLTSDDKQLLERAKFEEQMTAYMAKRLGWIKKALVAGGAVIAATVGYQFFSTRSIAKAAASAELDTRVADVASLMQQVRGAADDVRAKQPQMDAIKELAKNDVDRAAVALAQLLKEAGQPDGKRLKDAILRLGSVELVEQVKDTRKDVDALKTASAGLDAMVPVGTVVAYWGDRRKLPVGWELCDGELVTTAGSSIVKQRKPKLWDRFLKGAREGTDDVAKAVEEGGLAELDLRHSHEAGDLFAMIGQQLVSKGDWDLPHVARGTFTPKNDGNGIGGQTRSAHATGPGWSGIEDYTPKGVAVGGTTGGWDKRLDNRPPFVSVLYIIRVK